MNGLRLARALGIGLPLAVGLAGCGAKPAESELKRPLEKFLLARAGRDCRGTLALDHLSIKSVGDYDYQFRGYPVYAAFATKCRQGASEFTWNGDAPDVAAGFARRSSSGDWEVFVPELFQQGEEQLRQQVQRMMSK